MGYLIFMVALLMGSFLNVCIYRISRGESVVFPPSHCPNCNQDLKVWDLIPVFSYIFIKGKCRYCKSPISPRYPLVEILNTILWLLLYFSLGFTGQFIFYSIFTSLLLVIAFIDLEHYIIPDGLNLLGLTLALVAVFLPQLSPSLIEGILGFLIGGGSFLLIALATNGAMGGGDIKLMGVLGLALGWQMILLVFLLSFTLGAIISLFLLITKRKERKDPIPFGPFITLAAYIVFLRGEKIISLYINYLGM